MDSPVKVKPENRVAIGPVSQRRKPSFNSSPSIQSLSTSHGPCAPEMSFNHSPQSILGSADIEHTQDSQHGDGAQLGSKHGRPEDNTEVHTMVEITADDDLELARPPYLHAMLAGGIGGTTGDILMHSLDTVKTRQQGDPHWPPKYRSLGDAYLKIFRQEGVRKGLYGGFTAAMLGSFPGTLVFFGTYEFCKRTMLDQGVNPSFSFLTSGFLADFVASFLYVPSEVLKTRLQLQGQYNNPFFYSGYNYKSTLDAARTIVRVEGVPALYSGYKATIVRDLPFSAFQFALYEQFRRLSMQVTNTSDIGLGLEILTAVSAGGIAGAVTCPLDVVKTRIQTQITPDSHDQSSQSSKLERVAKAAQGQKRHIHSGPRTVPSTVPTLDTSSVLTGLRMIYKTEGVAGWFRGVGPRTVWTSVQSGTMLVMYQYLLKQFERMSEKNNGSEPI